MAAKKSSSSSRSNISRFPGIEYFERVGLAWTNALSVNRKALDDAWSEMKDGTYDYKQMMKTWADTAESYYGVAVEAQRGPGYQRQPVWVYFDYGPQRGGPARPNTLERLATLERTESEGTNLECTEFASLLENDHLDPEKVYSTLPQWEGASRSRIYMALDTDFIHQHVKPPKSIKHQQQYISFILAAGRTSEPPLVIVMLRVSF